MRGPKPLAVFWIFAGVMHFVIPKTYEAIMPDYLPAHKELVAASGVAEIAGGLGVLHPKLRPLARWWLVATIAAVFPANVWMVQEHDRFSNIPLGLLWARLPFQAVFVLWALRASSPDR